jgi:TRAP transporter TAXI family solute receptor
MGGLLSAGRTKLCRVAVAFLVAAGCSASGAQAQGKKADIRIATGTPAGAYYVMGAVLADTLNRSGRFGSAASEAVSGSVEGARLIESQEATLAAMDSNWSVRAREGRDPFKKVYDLTTVVPLGVWSLFFVALESSNISSINDLKGKQVAVGAKGSGMEMHARQVLGSLGWNFESDIRPLYLAFGPGASAVREGKAAAQLQCCLPNAGFTELTELAKARVIPMTRAELDKVASTSGVYTTGVLPKGSFKGHNEDTPSLVILNGFMAMRSLDDETAYLVAKTFIENIDAITEKSPQYASVKQLFDEAKTKGEKVLEMGAPLHPGALRAYKEVGILK